MCQHHRDPESIAHARESAEWGTFEVVILNDGSEEIGTLDEEFANDFDATMAARENEIEDVGISAEVRQVDD
jgi:hypothetical protein